MTVPRDRFVFLILVLTVYIIDKKQRLSSSTKFKFLLQVANVTRNEKRIVNVK